MCWLCGPASQQPRSLFIGVAHRRSAEPACCLVPARLWEQPLTQEKNNGGIVQKIRSSPGLALVLCAARLDQICDLSNISILSEQEYITHNAMVPLSIVVYCTDACLQSLRSGQDKVSAGCWLLVRGHGTGDGDTCRDGAAVSIQSLDSTTNMTAALTRRKAAEVGLEMETNIPEVLSCTITEKDPTRAFSWLKVPSIAFTFRTLSNRRSL